MRKSVSMPPACKPGSLALSASFVSLIGKLCEPDVSKRSRLHELWTSDPWLLWARSVEEAVSSASADLSGEAREGACAPATSEGEGDGESESKCRKVSQ